MTISVNIDDLDNEAYLRGISAGRQIERQHIIEFIKELKEYWSEQVYFEYGKVSAIDPDQLIDFIEDNNEDI